MWNFRHSPKSGSSLRKGHANFHNQYGNSFYSFLYFILYRKGSRLLMKVYAEPY